MAFSILNKAVESLIYYSYFILSVKAMELEEILPTNHFRNISQHLDSFTDRSK